MTLYHRLRVWGIKGYRLATSGFKWVRPRSANSIFLKTVVKKCDYCGEVTDCIVFECDYEVYATVCKHNLEQALSCFDVIPSKRLDPVPFVKDHRGIVM